MIRTERLYLRGWTDADAAPHNAMCADPAVSEMLGSVPTLADSVNVVARQNALLEAHGYCFWAIEHDGAFAGWCGLKPGKPPIDGELEIGWSLHPRLWGRGLATEAALACIRHAWERTDAPAVVAITSTGNTRSQAVMRRLGMTRRMDGAFDHPDLLAGHPLRPHQTFDLRRPAHG